MVFRVVLLPLPASWAMCTTWRSVGRRNLSWRRCCWIALTVGKPTSPRLVWSTTWNQSMLRWVNTLYIYGHQNEFTGLHWIKSSFTQAPQKSEEDEALKAQREANPERTASGRVQRASAQVANFHLAEIANNELPKDWPKRKFQSDLVPDDKKAREDSVLNVYTKLQDILEYLCLLYNIYSNNLKHF